VRENLTYDLQAPSDLSRLDEWLQRFELLDFADYLAIHLSAGQRRKIALIRLLMTPASLWLLDEPLVALDAASQGLLMQIIQDYRSHGGLVVLSSHQPLPLSGASWQEYQL
jgi:heme exporter protein A